MVNILSYGGGVNSTALLFLLIDLRLPLNEVVFADTGAELPDTYQYIKQKIYPFCENNKIKFTVVRNKESIYDWYYKHRKIPTWKTRSCTDLFKIRPIRRYLKRKYKNNIVLYIGISYDEKHRAKESDVSYIKNKFPLVELKIDRKKCEEIILSHGFEVPVKSGCYFCPFQPEWRWLYLKFKYPKLFKLAMKLEENGSAFPKLTLSRKGILRRYIKQKSLNEAFKGVIKR